MRGICCERDEEAIGVYSAGRACEGWKDGISREKGEGGDLGTGVRGGGGGGGGRSRAVPLSAGRASRSLEPERFQHLGAGSEGGLGRRYRGIFFRGCSSACLVGFFFLLQDSARLYRSPCPPSAFSEGGFKISAQAGGKGGGSALGVAEEWSLRTS